MPIACEVRFEAATAMRVTGTILIVCRLWVSLHGRWRIRRLLKMLRSTNSTFFVCAVHVPLGISDLLVDRF